ncbi:NACHT, LRR and PYD domains-containing protein 12-like, partial [Stylophora pistillata]|uniref:NACHT, LRR and PYD domains-containing protein 12-like n=1 Tax=Stylophora pistillata TaxID=50429 RepID=UPI000C03F413
MDDVSFEYIVNHPEEVLIILDGYDEYSQKDYLAGNLEKEYLNDARYKMPAAAFCSKLIRGKILKGSVVVVTMRPEEMNKLGGIRFEQLVEIAGFSSEQVKEYIEKYFKENEKVKNAVLEHVMKNENLVSFAHIPMLCYLLCFEMEYILNKTENPDDLPISMTDIYTKLIDIFVLKHCADSEYRQNEMPEKFEPLPVIKNTLEKLSELAAKLLLESKPSFDESEIEGGFELQEVNKVIGSGLLYCVKTFRTGSTETTKHFSFIHLTVQEYLAARWFVKENRIPDKKCSAVVFQFMAGILSRERNGELMEELLTSGQGLEGNTELLRAKCLSEYKDEEFAQQFIRNHSKAICNSHGEIFLDDLSNVDCIAVSFVLDIISELNKEEAGKAQHKCSDKFIAVKTLRLFLSRLTLSGIQRVCNSLINEHCLVSELNLLGCNLADECVDVMEGLVLSKLTTLDLSGNNITETGVASLCEALQHQSCKLTTLGLGSNEITDTGVASLCEALQHPSCKLTT